jgi:hypothetical protein
MATSNNQTVLMLALPAVAGIVALALAVALGSAALALALGSAAVVCAAVAAWRVTVVNGAAMQASLEVKSAVSSAGMGDRRRPTFDRQTGLFAEWYFRLRFDEEILRAKRYGHNLTGLALSPRRPENIEALRDAARACLRQVDFAADLGGVIGVCLPDTTREGSQVVIDRIVQSVPDAVVHAGAYPADGLTLSALLDEQAWRTRPIDDETEPSPGIAA